MIDISVSEARKDISEIVNRVGYAGERAVLRRHGREVAAVVGIVDLVLLETLEQQFDIESLRSALGSALEQGTTTLDGLRSEMGLV